MNSTEEGHICRPPFWEVIAAANFSRWSNFRRPRVASSLAVEESDNRFEKPMGVRHVSREYEKGYKPLRGAEERGLLVASCMVVGTVPGAAGGCWRLSAFQRMLFHFRGGCRDLLEEGLLFGFREDC